MRRQGLLQAGCCAAALCAAFAAQAGPAAPLAPACVASVAHPAWADCAAALSGQNKQHQADTLAGDAHAFDAIIDSPFGLSAKVGHALSPFDVDRADALIAASDATTQRVSANLNSAANGRPHGAVVATQPVGAIPEPHTLLLMLAGLVAIGFMASHRRRS